MAPRRGDGASATLADRLDAIGEGIRLRRRLDGLVPDEATESSRRAVVNRLVELQRAAGEELAGLRSGTARHREVATRAREWLGEARIAVRNALTVLQFEPLHQAMALEALRADLEWLSVVVARLDGEAPLAPTVWLDIELERLRGSLSPPDGWHPDPHDQPVRTRCERMKAGLLERRVRRELARPIARRRPRVALGAAVPPVAAPGAGRRPGPGAGLRRQPRGWSREARGLAGRPRAPARRAGRRGRRSDDGVAAVRPPRSLHRDHPGRLRRDR